MACATSNFILITEKMARRYPEEHDDDGLSDDDDNNHSGDDDISNHLNKLSLRESESECEIVSHTDTSITISTGEYKESINSCINENSTVNDTVTDHARNVSTNDSIEGRLEKTAGQDLFKKKIAEGRGPMYGYATSTSRNQRPAKPGSRRDEQYNDEESEVPSKFSNPGPQQPYPDTIPCYPSQQINSNVISGFNSFSMPTIQKQTARQALELTNFTAPGMSGLNQYQQIPPHHLNTIPNPDFSYSPVVYKNEYNNNYNERSYMDIICRPTCSISERQNLMSSNYMQPLDGQTRNFHVTQNGSRTMMHHISPVDEGVSCRSSISSESGFCPSLSDSPPASTLNNVSESKYQPYSYHNNWSTSEVGHDEDDDGDKFVRDLMNMYGVTQDDDIENTVVDTDRIAETRRSETQETLRNPSVNTWRSNYNGMKNVRQMLPVTTTSSAYPFVNTTTPNINFASNGLFPDNSFPFNQSDQKPKMYVQNVFKNYQCNNQSKASENVQSLDTKTLNFHNASNVPEFLKTDFFPNDPNYSRHQIIANKKLKDNMVQSSAVKEFQTIPELRIDSVIGNNTNNTTASKVIDNNYLENNIYSATSNNNDKHRENFAVRGDKRSTSSVGSYLSASSSPRSLDSFNTLPSPDVTSLASVQSSSPDTANTPDPLDDEEKRILAHRAVAALSTRDLLQADEHLDTELHSSVIGCDYYMVDALIDRYKRDETLDQVINAKNNNLQTPLCLSVILNEPRIAELLIAEGADTNAIVRRKARASDGKPSASFDHLIHFSASRGEDWLKVLRHLLHSPTTKINSFNSEGQTAVHCAVLAHNKPPKDVSSPKMTAGVINSIKTIAALSTAGANLNLPDQSSGKAPLHCAIEERDHDLVHRILSTAAHKDQQSENSLGSILSAKTNSGNTALHLAASVRMSEDAQIRLVRLLISKGADPSTKNGDGLLPREVAVYPAIVKLLKGSCSSPSSRYS